MIHTFLIYSLINIYIYKKPYICLFLFLFLFFIFYFFLFYFKIKKKEIRPFVKFHLIIVVYNNII